MWKLLTYMMLFLGGSLVTGCGGAYSEQTTDLIDSRPIAIVNEVPIYVESFKDGYVDYLLKTGLQDEDRYRNHFLQSQIEAQLLVQKARSEGIEQEEGYKAAFGRIEKKLLVDIFVRKAIFDTVHVSEDEVKEMFIRSQTTLTARHLFARTEEYAEQLYERVVGGESFEKLALEVFADTALANHGGWIGDFTVDEMDLAFEEAAYELEVGEVSRPVKTTQGYSIIKLEDRFVKPLITESEYAERRDRMYHFVSYRKKTAARKAVLDRLMGEIDPQYEPTTFSRLAAHIQGLTIMDGSESPSDWLRAPLVTFEGSEGRVTWAVQDFLSRATETGEKQRERVKSNADLRQFVSGLIARDEMAVQAMKLGYHRESEFELELKEAVDNWIWSNELDAVLASQAISTDTLVGYYNAYREEFNTEAGVQVWEILLDTKREADTVLAMLKNNSFEELARTHSQRPGAFEAKGDLGFLTAQQLGVLAHPVWSAKEGDILGPIELQGHYVLLRVGEKRLPRAMSFEEAREQIISQMRNKHRKALLKREIDSLREESTISVDESLLLSLPITRETNIDHVQ